MFFIFNHWHQISARVPADMVAQGMGTWPNDEGLVQRVAPSLPPVN
jgi:hypothetical protein